MINDQISDPSDRQLPERYKLFYEIEKLHSSFDQQAREQLRAAIHPDFSDELETDLSENPHLGITFNHKMVPVALDWADSAEIRFMYSSYNSGGVGPFATIAVHFFHDQSPLVFDEDLDRYGDEKSLLYEIVASAEFPPFIVFNEAVPEINSITRYLRQLREHQAQPRFLDDAECNAILGALQLQTVDIAEIAHSDFIAKPYYDHFDFRK